MSEVSAPDTVKSASVAAGATGSVAKPAVITVDSHLDIVAKLEAYITVLENDAKTAYAKYPVVACSASAAIAGFFLGLFVATL